MTADRLGASCVVLHGHLPWVHHPDHEEFLEEDWYLEAAVETYLPLLGMLDTLAKEGIPVRLATGLTPPLLEMMRAPALRAKTDRHLLRRRELSEEEVRRHRNDPPRRRAAVHYLRRAQALRETWKRIGGDPVGAFRRHRDEGRLEILASAATHAVLPLVLTPVARRAQVRIGVALYEEVFGAPPRGFWLPECAYEPGLDRILADEGVGYVILDTHGVLGAAPPPKTGIFRPIRLPAGVAAFGRDPASSRQVWAQEVGYPGDPAYRELYRDLGFDGDYAYVKRWLHQDGIRRNLGIKYHRVTGKVEMHEKELWDPDAARAQAKVHAGNFLWHRGEQARHLAVELGEPPVVLSPYDMELFGHWWYEGPWFLEDLFRQMTDPARRPPVRLLTPAQVLDEPGSVPDAAPGLCTWGEGGFLKVWLNEKNVWVLRHQQEIERRMIERAREHPSPPPGVERLLNQMLRELLLLQASDWAFIITKDTSAYYARKRVTDHVHRFLKLHDALAEPAALDPEWLATVEREDSLFPGLNYRILTGGPARRGPGPLGTTLPEPAA